MYDYYNYPQMQMYEESDDSEESENKIKNVINNDGFQHVTYVGINELYNQPMKSGVRFVVTDQSQALKSQLDLPYR